MTVKEKERDEECWRNRIKQNKAILAELKNRRWEYTECLGMINVCFDNIEMAMESDSEVNAEETLRALESLAKMIQMALDRASPEPRAASLQAIEDLVRAKDRVGDMQITASENLKKMREQREAMTVATGDQACGMLISLGLAQTKADMMGLDAQIYCQDVCKYGNSGQCDGNP